MDNLLITGDFMELTQVTRNTLIHYDNIGLLKPVKTNSRGDRFYHPFQYYTMQLIKIIQTAGLSLMEVKEFLESIDAVELGKLHNKWKEKFKIARRNLREEYLVCEKTLKFVDKISFISESFNLYIPNGDPILEDGSLKGNPYFSNLDVKCRMDQQVFYHECNKHILSTYGKLSDGSFPVITRFDGADFNQGENHVVAIGSYTFDMDHNKRPQGERAKRKYVVCRCVGGTKELNHGMEKVRKYLADHNLKLYSDVYVVTNLFMVQSDGERVGDRMICAPISEEGSEESLAIFDRSDMPLAEDDVNKASRLSSGQFIKLCQITRNTLNYYESQNLLHAEYVEENGYKKYGADQIYTMIYIKSLKQADFSIEEIKEILVSNDIGIDNFFNRHTVLKEKRKTIEEKLKALYMQRIMLKDISGSLRNIEAISKVDNSFLTIKRDSSLRYKVINNVAKGLENYNIFEEVNEVVKQRLVEQGIISYPVLMLYDGARKSAKVSTGFFVADAYKGDDTKSIKGETYVAMIKTTPGEVSDRVYEMVDLLVAKKGRIIRDEIVVIVLAVGVNEDNTYRMRVVVFVPTR